MQKIIPLNIAKIGSNPVGNIIGINTNRIHGDIAEVGSHTKIRYYIDPDKEITETLFIKEDPAVIYRELDGPSLSTDGTFSLVGGGTVVVDVADIIYCYSDSSTYERCSIDVISGGRRTLHVLDMTFLELLTEINSI